MTFRVLFALLLCAAAPVSAQRILGEFTGVVTDAAGASVPNAKVSAIETSTKRQWTVQTNEEGLYRIGSLPGGSAYELRVEQSGFKTARLENVVLDVGNARRADFRLELGQISESVTVSSDSGALDLERSEVGAVVKQRAVVDLPLNGRSVYQLAELQPGVVRVAGTGLQESETTNAQVGAGGTRFRDNQILLDGTTNNNDRQGGRTTMNLSPDAVEEFRIITNNMSAEYGRSGGAVISVISRGGTNDLHGSAFWFLRNDNLDASNTFEARGGTQPEFKQHQFGGTAGGPIVKNRLFWFGSYQGLRQGQPGTRLATVETPQFRDFVLRTRPNTIAARLLRDFPPLANPTFNIRDIGSPVKGVRVNGPADGIPDLGDVYIPVKGYQNDDQYSGRLDATMNGGKDSFNVRFSLNTDDRQSASGNSVRAFTATTTELDENFGLNHTHIFSPKLINDLRLGWNFDPQYTDGNYPEIPWITMNVAGRTAANFNSTDGYVFPLDIRTNTYQIYDSLALSFGRHSVKVGGELRWFQENSEFPTYLKPSIAFDDLLDFADDDVLTVLARVNPNTGTPSGTYRNFRSTEFGFFVQDDIKLTSRLTLNLGLRYDNFGTLGEKNGKLSTLVQSGGNAALGRITRVDPLYQRDNNNFAPRFGLAWDPTGSSKWAIRAGGGIFYSRLWSNFTGNTRFNPPDSLQVTLSALTAGQNPSASYRIPFEGDPQFARPLDANGGSIALRPGTQTVAQDLRAPYNIQWFAGVQRRLPGDWVTEVNYMGNAGRKLLIRNDINRFSGDRADGTLDRVNTSFGVMTHGFNAVSSSYHALASQVSRRFRSGYQVQMSYTFSRSIDADSEPFGGGAGEAQGVMEVNNIRLDRGLSAFDATHRLAGTAIWELPFFRGNRSVAGTVLGGWQLNGIISLQSGFPFTAVTSEDYNLDGAFTDRPNATGPIARKVGDSPRAFSDGAFGPASAWSGLFVPAPSGTTPQLGRNIFRGPGYASIDGSLFKEFRAPGFRRDSARWQFRAEFFNLFNRVNMRGVTNSLGSFNATTRLWSNVNFGRSVAAFSGRQIQLALKLRF
jgi:hypothetical protein